MTSIARILALVDDSSHAPQVLKLANSLAARLGGRLDAAYAVDPMAGTYLSPEVSATVIAIVRQQFEQGRDRAAALLHELAGDAAELQLADGGTLHELTRLARLSDLVVLGQSDPDERGFARAPVGPRLLMGSGRPLLFVPYAGEFEQCTDRVLLAWSDSRESTRALHDALPILHLAKSVDVLGFAPSGADISASLDAVLELLAAHGISASRSQHICPAPSVAERILAPSSVDASIAEMLLSIAADRAADLIVMGGYGHARALEFVMGGVTRTMLGSMTVPVLMTH